MCIISHSLCFFVMTDQWPVNSLHKWPVTQKMCLFDDVIMCIYIIWTKLTWYGLKIKASHWFNTNSQYITRQTLCSVSSSKFIITSLVKEKYLTSSTDGLRCRKMCINILLSWYKWLILTDIHWYVSSGCFYYDVSSTNVCKWEYLTYNCGIYWIWKLKYQHFISSTLMCYMKINTYIFIQLQKIFTHCGLVMSYKSLIWVIIKSSNALLSDGTKPYWI